MHFSLERGYDFRTFRGGVGLISVKGLAIRTCNSLVAGIGLPVITTAYCHYNKFLEELIDDIIKIMISKCARLKG